MVSNREERRQQRLRGAQRHQVQDMDFGLSIPIAAAPQLLNARRRTTPQPEPQPQLSKQQTPGSGRAKPQSAKSSLKRQGPNATLSANNANTSAKRRKLDVQSQSSPRSTRSSQLAPRPDIYDLPEEEVQQEITRVSQEDDELVEDQSILRVSSQRRVREEVLLEPLASPEEVSESPGNAPGSGRRNRADLAKSQKSTDSLRNIFADDTPTTVRRSARTARHTPGSVEDTRLSPESNMQISVTGQMQAHALDELSPDQPVRRSRGRSSKVQIEQFDIEPDVSKDTEANEEDQAEEIDDTEAVKRLRQGRGRKRSTAVINNDPQEEEEIEVDELDQAVERLAAPQPKRRNKSKVKARPAVQRQGKKRTVAVDLEASPAVQRQGKTRTVAVNTEASKPRDSIAITVHRLTKPVLFAGEDSEADILNADIPFAKRSGVNAVDVFSQMCEEIIGSARDNLDEGGQNAEDAPARKEYRVKLKAVEDFQEALQMRLLELTINLDSNYALMKRVRAAQRQKIELRTELLRVRAEREQVALRMDEVRTKHESSSTAGQDQLLLNAALHDIELAVSTARERATSSNELAAPPLSALIATVASQASSKSNGGGLLNRIKEFNDFLERAAMALEGRG